MTVDEIFADAKQRFGWADDSSTFGRVEYWATPKELIKRSQHGELTGDCDDFAALCVSTLRAAGFPARFVLCKTEDGEMHLVAETGGMILDNRHVLATPKHLIPYTWISISGYAPGAPWHEVAQ